jgi:hypothetical protein
LARCAAELKTRATENDFRQVDSMTAGTFPARALAAS